MISQSGTLTSKGQITIPSKMIKSANFKKGQKIVFSFVDGKIYLETAINQVNQLAGSLTIPKKYQNIDLDNFIQQSKEEHFANKKYDHR
jgi:bifunctional DNA-binding transcriptional regulator/antitoxin component of YhaV-PrlF toxin-antitoxin module